MPSYNKIDILIVLGIGLLNRKLPKVRALCRYIPLLNALGQLLAAQVCVCCELVIRERGSNNL